eukprot:gnl/TRDRNA2_/TRDRNA2_90998_c0_seq1.p1 gnl/TRDRNA2_/TRDRNA2_90998_c0~~gnl/TRDRNA2_/TRDRNA2_90998_c0_seq1.p1  ORF type:complete len:492 (+),score=69.59 gnl/TRDRNA2_/TRDRNA2_90998_c0_seq1:46-1521(+)
MPLATSTGGTANWSLNGSWECIGDFMKCGTLTKLTVEITDATGVYYQGSDERRDIQGRLSAIEVAWQDAKAVVNFEWSSCKRSNEDGSGNWRFDQSGNNFEGHWDQFGHHAGPWMWSGKRKELVVAKAFPTKLTFPTLTREQCVEMEKELIKAYSSESFQEKLHKAWHAVEDDFLAQARVRQEVCLPVQAPIIAKYGFEPSKKGVQQSVNACSPYDSIPEIHCMHQLLAWLVNPSMQAIASPDQCHAAKCAMVNYGCIDPHQVGTAFREVLAAKGSAPWVARLKDGKRQHLVAFGTSLTARGGWVKQLDAALSEAFPTLVTVTNRGENGVNSLWALRNLQERVLSLAPDVLFLEFVVNDSHSESRLSPNTSSRNICRILDALAHACPQCDCVLMTTNPCFDEHLEARRRLPEYLDAYREVARKRGCLLIDHYPEWLRVFDQDPSLRVEYIPDGLHPSYLGDSQVVAPSILAAIGVSAPCTEQRWAQAGSRT